MTSCLHVILPTCLPTMEACHLGCLQRWFLGTAGRRRVSEDSPLVKRETGEKRDRSLAVFLSFLSNLGLRTCVLWDPWTGLAHPVSGMLRNPLPYPYVPLALPSLPCSEGPFLPSWWRPHTALTPSSHTGRTWGQLQAPVGGQEIVTGVVVSWLSPDAVFAGGTILEAILL